MKGDLAGLARAFDVTGNGGQIIRERTAWALVIGLASVGLTWKRLSRACIELFASEGSIAEWKGFKDHDSEEQFRGASTRGTVTVVFFVLVLDTRGIVMMVVRGSDVAIAAKLLSSSLLQFHPTPSTFVGSNALVTCAPTGKWRICMRRARVRLRLKQSPVVPLSKMSSHALNRG